MTDPGPPCGGCGQRHDRQRIDLFDRVAASFCLLACDSAAALFFFLTGQGLLFALTTIFGIIMLGRYLVASWRLQFNRPPPRRPLLYVMELLIRFMQGLLLMLAGWVLYATPGGGSIRLTALACSIASFMTLVWIMRFDIFLRRKPDEDDKTDEPS
jgi:hypothetical protein